MRILLYSGKGGVGKTSVAGATAVYLAAQGKRTLIMSVDPAHSLADSFDLQASLFHTATSEPVEVSPGLHLQEVNINHEMKRRWRDISTYITAVLRTTGLSSLEAEEMAIFPGMEEMSAMMYVNQYRKESAFDVIILDCAPTAESLRFISLPSTLDWYMKHVFGFERSLLKAARPILNRISPVELPPDSYFRNVQELFEKIEGIDTILEDPSTTSVRLVTNAEKMVLRETQRAFVYFTLHGLTIDNIVVNRLLPESVHDSFFSHWRESQSAILDEITRYFDPVPVRKVPLFDREVVGLERLRHLAAQLYREGDDPSAISSQSPPFAFVSLEGRRQVQLSMPFAVKGEVSVFKKHDELIVEVGTIRRHIGLPTTMMNLTPVKARLNERMLIIEMEESA